MTISSYRFEDIQALHDAVGRCRACPLGGERMRAVPGEGPVPCDLMLVGEGPGEEEDRQGWPFVGRAGFLLESLLWDAGVDRGAVYITNTVRCRPTVLDQAQQRDRPPSAEEMLMCSGFLAAQLAMVRPRLVILCGRVACEWLAHERIADLRGRVVLRSEVPMFVMYHPAAGLRSGKHLEILRRDMPALKRWLARNPGVRTTADAYAGSVIMAPEAGSAPPGGGLHESSDGAARLPARVAG